MSTDGRAVVTNARGILGDPDVGHPTFTNDQMRLAVNRQVALIASDLGLGSAWQVAAVSLAPGTIDYTLPGSSEYAQVLEIVYTSDRMPLPIRSVSEVQLLRSGSLGQGRPGICALRPTSTQTVVLMTDTDPTASETLDLLTTLVPSSWDASDASPPTIPFSQKAALALELRVAASVASAAGPEKRNAVGLGQNDVRGWLADAAELVRQERNQIINLKRSRGAYGGAWFSAWWR